MKYSQILVAPILLSFAFSLMAEDQEVKKISILPDFKVSVGSDGVQVEKSDNTTNPSSEDVNSEADGSVAYRFAKTENSFGKTASIVTDQASIDNLHYKLKKGFGFKTLDEKSNGNTERAKWIAAQKSFKYSATPGHNYVMRDRLALPRIHDKKLTMQIELVYVDEEITEVLISHNDNKQGASITSGLVNMVNDLISNN